MPGRRLDAKEVVEVRGRQVEPGAAVARVPGDDREVVDREHPVGLLRQPVAEGEPHRPGRVELVGRGRVGGEGEVLGEHRPVVVAAVEEQQVLVAELLLALGREVARGDLEPARARALRPADDGELLVRRLLSVLRRAHPVEEDRLRRAAGRALHHAEPRGPAARRAQAPEHRVVGEVPARRLALVAVDVVVLEVSVAEQVAAGGELTARAGEAHRGDRLVRAEQRPHVGHRPAALGDVDLDGDGALARDRAHALGEHHPAPVAGDELDPVLLRELRDPAEQVLSELSRRRAAAGSPRGRSAGCGPARPRRSGSRSPRAGRASSPSGPGR